MSGPTILVIDDNNELVVLLTTLFESAGYTVVGANKGRAGIEAAKTSSPALVVIDLLLPDMMGYAVAEAIRGAVPDVPLIFISGVFRGAKHANESGARFPGAKYFEKPFDAKKLLAQVTQTVPPPAVTAPPPPPAAEEYEVELDVDVDDTESSDDEMELTGKIRVMREGAQPTVLQGADLTAQPSKGPVAGARPAAQASASGLRTSSSVRVAKKGELTDNLPGLISAFFQAKETGELYCQKGKVKKVVYFESGAPVFAMSNLAADRFGQFLVRVGKIKAEQLEDAAVVAAESKRRVGDVLVERGLLKDTERPYYLAQQVKSIIYSLFGWEEGQFVLAFKEKARAENIKLDLFPGNLIVRGIKKLYKPARLLRLVADGERLIPSQNPAYQLHELELEKWEAQLLARADGTRSNQELIALAGRPDHQVRAFLAAMLGVQILELRQDFI